MRRQGCFVQHVLCNIAECHIYGGISLNLTFFFNIVRDLQNYLNFLRGLNEISFEETDYLLALQIKTLQ